LTQQDQYPTIIISNDTWNDPTYALGVPDALCAYKIAVDTIEHILDVGGYNFSFLGDSDTLNNLYMNLHSYYQTRVPYQGYLLLRVRNTRTGVYNDYASLGGTASADCTQCLYFEYDVLPLVPFTIADLKAGYLQTQWVYASNYALIAGYVESLRVRTDYTPAAPPGVPGPLGNGLTWIQFLRVNPYRNRERKRERERVYTLA